MLNVTKQNPQSSPRSLVWRESLNVAYGLHVEVCCLKKTGLVMQLMSGLITSRHLNDLPISLTMWLQVKAQKIKKKQFASGHPHLKDLTRQQGLAQNSLTNGQLFWPNVPQEHPLHTAHIVNIVLRTTTCTCWLSKQKKKNWCPTSPSQHNGWKGRRVPPHALVGFVTVFICTCLSIIVINNPKGRGLGGENNTLTQYKNKRQIWNGFLWSFLLIFQATASGGLPCIFLGDKITYCCSPAQPLHPPLLVWSLGCAVWGMSQLTVTWQMIQTSPHREVVATSTARGSVFTGEQNSAYFILQPHKWKKKN